ncbi:winged helix DNA-binding domain-containing protein [Microbacterium sp. X-17]|uniref:winged helix DNA-binding domain-containing protein n=1 Tax=Microbacterium sp. X-17 TaxID=3144404 RepID=UPI0031F4EE9B
MTANRTLERRLRSHRLSAPARTVEDAARHMLAVQAQEFWGGRWALAARASGAPSVSRVDAAFARRRLVRTWTMRGTLHVAPAEDVGWMLSVTGERQLRMAAPRHRELGLDVETLARAERVVRAALTGGGRLTRKEFADVLAAGGVDPVGQRGIHVLQSLALRGVIVWGPVVPNPSGPTREQYVVLTEEWIDGSAAPADPLAEFFARYIGSHGPATVRDFAWWSGLPLGVARSAAEAAGDRLVVAADGTDPAYVLAGAGPRRSATAPEVIALPPFEEYYLSYVDRSLPCVPEFGAIVGPAQNGIVRPVLLARGEIVGVWTHSRAVGRHADDPVPELFVPGAATDAEVAAALDRYAAFISG